MLKNGELLVKQRRPPTLDFGLAGKGMVAQHDGKGAPKVNFS